MPRTSSASAIGTQTNSIQLMDKFIAKTKMLSKMIPSLQQTNTSTTALINDMLRTYGLYINLVKAIVKEFDELPAPRLPETALGGAAGETMKISAVEREAMANLEQTEHRFQSGDYHKAERRTHNLDESTLDVLSGLQDVATHYRTFSENQDTPSNAEKAHVAEKALKALKTITGNYKVETESTSAQQAAPSNDAQPSDTASTKPAARKRSTTASSSNRPLKSPKPSLKAPPKPSSTLTKPTTLDETQKLMETIDWELVLDIDEIQMDQIAHATIEKTSAGTTDENAKASDQTLTTTTQVQIEVTPTTAELDGIDPNLDFDLNDHTATWEAADEWKNIDNEG